MRQGTKRKPLLLSEVRLQLRNIAGAAKSDAEQAHSLEDDLHQTVLAAIAQNAIALSPTAQVGDASARSRTFAKLALSSTKIDFPRHGA